MTDNYGRNTAVKYRWITATAIAGVTAASLAACGSTQGNLTPKQQAYWNHQDAIALHGRALADLMESCAGKMGAPEGAVNGSTPYLSRPMLTTLATRGGRTQMASCLSTNQDWWGSAGQHLGAAKQAALAACFRRAVDQGPVLGENGWTVGDDVVSCITGLMARDG